MEPVIWVVSDLHVGSTLGLWPEGFPVEDGGIYGLNVFQKYLNVCWWEMLAKVLALPEPPIVVVAGDLIQGAHDRDGQLVTDRSDIQAEAAYEVLKPLREACERMYILHGTSFHGGKSSQHVGSTALRLEGVRQPQTGRPLWWELFLDMDGAVIHFTHHIGATNIPMYEASVPLRANYVLQADLLRNYGAEAPQICLDVRGHRHRCIYVYKPPSVRSLTLPCWQLKGEFGFKVAADTLPDIGYAVIERTLTDLNVNPVLYPLPGVHIEKGI